MDTVAYFPLIRGKTRKVEQAFSNRIEPLLPAYIKKLFFEHDWDAERQFRERGSNRDILFVSCAGLVKNKVLMQDTAHIAGIIGVYDASQAGLTVYHDMSAQRLVLALA